MTSSNDAVLIADDSRAINQMLTHSIEDRLKIDVVSAFSMEEAKQHLSAQKHSFLVAILDVNLPDAPNGEVIDHVLGLNIPVIVLTGSESDDLHRAMVEKQIIDYVVKRNFNEIEYVIDLVKRLQQNRFRKVMVVDDSCSSRQLISSLLQRQYLNVLQAVNGVEALELMEKHDDVCLIITDYNMPKMDGMSLTTKVRELYSRNELAIIGISTNGNDIVSIKLLKSGANDFIVRPFMHEEFYCRINQNIDLVANYRLLQDASNRDFLTGLYNRKYIFGVSEQLFMNAKRDNFSMATAMIDIDHFKSINDTYGHDVGDLALKHVTTIFNTHLRKADFIARIGGEEFCLLCINVDNEAAKTLLNRFRKAVETNPLVLDEATIPITISIGYTTQLADSLDPALKLADAALYEAKEGGRNRVIQHSTQGNLQIAPEICTPG